MKEQDRKDFQAYLRACTNRQLYGVLEKEAKTYRREYMRLVGDELRRRGLEVEA